MIPLKLQPAFKDYLWGGTRLVTEYGKKTSLSPVAESWELSCHPDGPSLIANGPLSGKMLADVLQEQPQLLGTKGQGFEDFPILIKLIDAKEPLSLQVHPDDAYARRVEQQFGKNEMWYILDCDPGAEIILGFQKPLSQKAFRSQIADNTILDSVHSIPVAPGDCFCIPAGLLHAIGKGILVAEVQQSSNVTYRVYDYARRDAQGNLRPLHVDQAVEVTDTTLTVEKSDFPVEIREGYTSQKLTDWSYFCSQRLVVSDAAALFAGEESFHSLLCLEGCAELFTESESIVVKKGECVFLPAGLGHYTVKGSCSLLFTSL